LEGLFWLAWLRSGDQRDLRTGVERQNAGVLGLGLVVMCSGAGGSGWRDVGVATVKGVGAFTGDGVGSKVGVVGGDGAGGEDDTDSVVGTAVAVVAAIAVVECIGIAVVGTQGR